MSEKNGEDWSLLYLFVFLEQIVVGMSVSYAGDDVLPEHIEELGKRFLAETAAKFPEAADRLVVRALRLGVGADDPGSKEIRKMMEEFSKWFVQMFDVTSHVLKGVINARFVELLTEQLPSLPALPDGDNVEPDATSAGDEPDDDDDELGEPDPDIGKPPKPSLN